MITGDWKLGVDATHLISIPNPTKGLDRTPTQVAAMQQSLAGADTRHVFAYKRTWSLPFDMLLDSEYALLLQFWNGTKGLGPFILVDPYYDGGQKTVNITGFTETIPLKDNHACVVTFQEVNGA